MTNLPVLTGAKVVLRPARPDPQVVDGYYMLLVVQAIRDEDEHGQPVELIRIVSAREADRQDRRRYEQETR